MAIRRYEMQDRSLNVDLVTKDDLPMTPREPDVNLSLQQVYNMTDWEDEEFDHVASMKVGDEHTMDGIYIKRTA